MSALQEGWAAYEDAEGRTYYANTSTGETSWEPPLAAASALPDGWAAHQDAEGRTFYANSVTGETSWEPPAAAAPPAAPALGLWSVDFTYTLGPEGCEHIFQGKAQMLDRNLYSSVSSVVESLNAGVPAVPEGFCVVWSNSKQNYFLLWREEKEAEAFATLEIATESSNDLSWSAGQCTRLGPVGSEDSFAGRADILDKARFDSVTGAVEALNAGGLPEGERGFCVVWSASQDYYHLLWRQDKEAEACLTMGIPMEPEPGQ